MSDTPKSKRKTQKQLQQDIIGDLEGETIEGRDDKTREEYRRDFRVPLFAYNLLRGESRSPIDNKDTYKDTVANWIRTWRWHIENEDELRDRTFQIYRSLKETIIDVIPRNLVYLPEWASLVTHIYALQFDPSKDYNALKYFFWFLELKHADIDRDWEESKQITAWVEDPEKNLTPQQEAAKELRKKADQKMKEDKNKQVEGIKPDDGDFGIGL